MPCYNPEMMIEPEDVGAIREWLLTERCEMWEIVRNPKFDFPLLGDHSANTPHPRHTLEPLIAGNLLLYVTCVHRLFN
jgi:hypothetical protein